MLLPMLLGLKCNLEMTLARSVWARCAPRRLLTAAGSEALGAAR